MRDSRAGKTSGQPPLRCCGGVLCGVMCSFGVIIASRSHEEMRRCRRRAGAGRRLLRSVLCWANQRRVHSSEQQLPNPTLCR